MEAIFLSFLTNGGRHFDHKVWLCFLTGYSLHFYALSIKISGKITMADDFRLLVTQFDLFRSLLLDEVAL